jgi:hypothetical protein
MTSLKQDLVKRIERLPKPRSVTSALQPLFEAVSNAIHSTNAKFGDTVSINGSVTVMVSTTRRKADLWASVEDNGIGLDTKNWNAFTTTDTDNKIGIGGKGVGRLLWLDCFGGIEVKSVFDDCGTLKRRSFQFVLAPENQIKNEVLENADNAENTSFHVRFTNVRNNGYLEKFPGRDNYVFQHFTSHFLPTFIGRKCPQIRVIVGEESRDFPAAIDEIVVRREPDIDLSLDEYGALKLTLMECRKIASADLKGSNFVHFIAHDRTVHSHCIDAKLGLKNFGENGDLVFHAILTGEFLDKNVNQERTAFLFEDSVIEKLIKDACIPPIEKFLAEPISKLKGEQREIIELITATYPSVAFGNTEELQKRVPTGELANDAIYGHLARERFRRDEKQAEKIRSVLSHLKNPGIDASSFSQTISEASKALEETEQRSLAEYVVRRKVVLDFIEVLLEKVRDDTRDSSYQREDVLHSFICPVRVNTVSDTRQISPASSHDLWIVDERLTFAQYFSSDVDFSHIASGIESAERPDLLIFDHVHGLRQTDVPSKVLLVEFKRPGRTEYSENENPQLQVQRYIKRLTSGGMKDVKGRPITLDNDTIFYCFIIADLCPKIEDWTFGWQHTADRRGRIFRPDSGFRGSIELIGWDALLEDAKARNRAFFDKAGITGESFFSNNA